MELKINKLSEFKFTPTPLLQPKNKLTEAIWVMLSSNFSSIPVTDERGVLKGVISINDVIKYFPPSIDVISKESGIRSQEIVNKISLPLKRVKDLMSNNAVSITLDTSLKEIISLFVEKQVFGKVGYRRTYFTGFPVVDSNGQVFGMITYIDILKLINISKSLPPVSDFMIKGEFIHLEGQDNLMKANLIMQSMGIRNIVVVEKIKGNFKPIGVISDTQLKRYMQEIYDFSKTMVADIMTDITSFQNVFETEPINKLINIFCNKSIGVRIYPVINKKGHMVGIVNYVDVLRKIQIN